MPLARATVGHDQFARLLSFRPRAQERGPLPFTTITINSRYGAGRHRDCNNDGPSIIAAFGGLVEGRLLPWLRDA